ncbi:phosphoadenosine phosphosulfate reductase family protein [Sphingomonas carotinifaciens]|uniref:Phosphoadenosine phosphosulfate reductase family protein n=1 Tax=Sphingomonas carotinifaciens TaxID=1166323 RepID=A0A1G7PWV6_9SPHN|nr:phosphoadenosine phosphosulfate reductase family protein [Sphingomonas carotinifaciens]MBB4087547.1 3'-phosphoadenosine 5'-phosphosulfate sulfotransferase (PAPS reductase)/FAD synthetase [Sphingomonas carotinifaciens]MWC45634.1 phosphoadenosine phosphosulfate reductase family protein [Sphingomonas carotinifaciens]SDF90802.1 Phosphoadenosine phosphosulfate reductase family protein [Sphingomonas carotinifaciens]
MSAAVARPDLGAYRRFVVAFSGGKDSLAALLHLLNLGVPAHAIELHHHDVDGGGPSLMDWPCTLGYVRAIAAHFGTALYVSWREGGFARELARTAEPTAPVMFETPTGIGTAGGNGPLGTRGLFPQTSPDLRVRWCSPALKIDVLAAAIRNQPRFLEGRSLVVTGERAEESSTRARYAPFERHRTSTLTRSVDHWRPVHDWSEQEVWAAVERSGVRPHPAYVLGWGRLSCRTCIFGSPDQWATVRLLFPVAFQRVQAREALSGKTIHRAFDVAALADRGRPFAAALDHPDALAQAEDEIWRLPIVMAPWRLPAGAFGDTAGPP